MRKRLKSRRRRKRRKKSNDEEDAKIAVVAVNEILCVWLRRFYAFVRAHGIVVIDRSSVVVVGFYINF